MGMLNKITKVTIEPNPHYPSLAPILVEWAGHIRRISHSPRGADDMEARLAKYKADGLPIEDRRKKLVLRGPRGGAYTRTKRGGAHHEGRK